MSHFFVPFAQMLGKRLTKEYGDVYVASAPTRGFPEPVTA
jgi:hypothetical protein